MRLAEFLAALRSEEVQLGFSFGVKDDGDKRAIAIVVWRVRLANRATTNGSDRWTEPEEIAKAGLIRPAGVFLSRTAAKDGRNCATMAPST